MTRAARRDTIETVRDDRRPRGADAPPPRRPAPAGPGWSAAVRSIVSAHPRLALFTLGYLAGFTALGLGLASPLTVPYLVVVGGAVALVVRLHARVRLGGGVLWSLACWGFAHMAGGVVPIGQGRTLYNLWIVDGWLKYDQAVHAFGFGTATFVCGTVLLRWLPAGPLPSGLAVLIVLAGMGVGAVNEIVEFGATLVLEHTNVGGYDNTGWDLVFDLLGAVVATVWLVRGSGGHEGGRRCTDTAYPASPDHGARSHVAHRSDSSRPAAAHMAS